MDLNFLEFNGNYVHKEIETISVPPNAPSSKPKLSPARYCVLRHWIQIWIRDVTIWLKVFENVCYILSGRSWHHVIMSIKNISFVRSFPPYLLTYSMEQSPSWEGYSYQRIKNFPIFYGTWKFIITFATSRHLNQINPVNSPHSTSWRSILLFSSHLRLDLLIGLFPPCFSTKIFMHLSSICGTCSAIFIFLDFITRLRSFLVCSFLQSHIISSLSGQIILVSKLFSTTLILYSFLTMSEQVTHPQKNYRQN